MKFQTISRCAVVVLSVAILLHAFHSVRRIRPSHQAQIPGHLLSGLTPGQLEIHCRNAFPFIGKAVLLEDAGIVLSQRYSRGELSRGSLYRVKTNCQTDPIYHVALSPAFVTWLIVRGGAIVVISMVLIEMRSLCRHCFCRKCNLRCRMKKRWRVWLEVQSARCQHAHSFIIGGKVVLCVATVLSAIQTNISCRDDEVEQFEEYCTNAYSTEYLPFVFVLTIFMILSRASPYPSAASLDSANIVMTVMWIWRYATLKAGWYDYWGTYMWVCRIIQSIVFGNAALSACLQSLISIVDVLCAWAHNTDFFRKSSGLFLEHSDRNTEAGLADEVLVIFGGYLVGQIVVTAMAVCLMFSFESLMVSQAELLLKAREADNASSLAHRLLSVMTDAVVHLDSNFCITKPCPKLASLMLSSSVGTELVGKQILSLIPNEEQSRFESTIAKCTSRDEHATSHAQALHIHLFDNKRAPFSVEVLMTAIDDADGSTRYILGIKEEGDERVVSSIPEENSVLEIPEMQSLSFQNQFVLDKIESVENALSYIASDGGTSDSGSSDDCIGFVGSETWVCVNAEDANFEILCCSTSFSFFLGLRRDYTALKNFLSEEDCIKISAFLSSPGGPSLSPYVTFRQCVLGGLTFVAQFKIIDAVYMESTFATHECEVACLALTNVQYADPKPRKLGDGISILVEVSDLSLGWFGGKCRDRKAYKNVLSDRHAFRKSLADPQELVLVLRRYLESWGAAGLRTLELPQTLGSYKLKQPSRNRHLEVELLNFFNVNERDVSQGKVLLFVSIRFGGRQFQHISL